MTSLQLSSFAESSSGLNWSLSCPVLGSHLEIWVISMTTRSMNKLQTLMKTVRCCWKFQQEVEKPIRLDYFKIILTRDQDWTFTLNLVKKFWFGIKWCNSNQSNTAWVFKMLLLFFSTVVLGPWLHSCRLFYLCWVVTHSWQSAEVSPQCPHVHSMLKYGRHFLYFYNFCLVTSSFLKL